MKKIYSSAMLLLAGVFAFTSCEKDIDSNPVLTEGSEPVAIVLNAPEFSQVDVSLAGTEALTLTWSQPQLNNLNAPVGASGSLGVSYAVQVSKNGSYTKTFKEALAEVTLEDGTYSGKPDSHDYVQLAATYSSCKAELTAAELNQALNELYVWDSTDELKATEAHFRVLALLSDGLGKSKTVAISNDQKVSLVPSKWIDVMEVPAKESYLWVPGGGNGWSHGVAPILVSSDGVVYTGYAYLDGDFKVTPKDNWDAEYNFNDFENKSANIEQGDGTNLKFTGDASMCYITVDLGSKSIDVLPVTWSIVGSFGWDSDQVMTYDTTNHCLTVDFTFDDGAQFKFRRDSAWDVNLGADDEVEPSTKYEGLVANGKNLVGPSGAHTVQLFIERPSQDGIKAVVK